MFNVFFQVECYGDVIGAIVAVTAMQAETAADAVLVQYEELQVITTIEVQIIVS